ncbi:MAG: flagellar M-ring protein FliF C-terminal domain-containing protein [Vulcanimicrobiaceae bacterium]
MNAVAFLTRWSALPPSARIAAALGGAVALCALAAIAFFTHSARSALFAGTLYPEQLAEVQEHLASWNVPFTPTADNVLVDAGRRSDLLLRLSLAGVPHAHIASSGDVLAKVSALTPQAVIDEQTRAGLAGDIELGLRGIDGVDDARVIVAPAKPGYFADERPHDPSASVRLRLRPGARLTRAAVAGIRAFVAASVPGLGANRVTILDDRGLALGAAGDDGDDAAGLQAQLQSALDTAIGPGASIVRVRVERDQRARSSREVRRVPLTGAPIALTNDAESYAGDGKQYEHTIRHVDRGSETRDVTTTVQPGRVARISVAIFVDAARRANLSTVRALAAAAAGIDPRRGDTIAVEAIDFARVPLPRKDGWWLAYGAIVPLLPTLVLALAALIAMRFASAPANALVRALVERAGIARATVAAAGVPPARVRACLQGEPPHAAAAVISALPAATAAAVLDLYPAHERADIVRRMQRAPSPLFPDAERFIGKA